MIFHSTFNKPVLLIGSGVRSSGASSLVVDFCKKTNIPALTTMNGVDLIQDDLHIGFIGTHGNRIANLILNECDLIISIGSRLGIRQVGHYPKDFAPKAKLIRVDIDSSELSRNIKDDEIKYNMDAKEFMKLLLEEEIPNYSGWMDKCLKAKELLKNYDKVSGNKAIEKISTLLPKNPIVSVDVGQNQCWAAQSLHLRGHDGRIFICGGYGAMGCALPIGIGASIASNKGKVFCIIGDGGFQMNIQELETVKREKLPLKLFILNNKVLGKISETQHNNHDNRYAQTTKESGYTVPDFKKISEAYGIKAVELVHYEDLALYEDSIKNNDACLFNIMLPEESYLYPKIKWEEYAIEPTINDKVLSVVLDFLRF